MPFRVGAAEAVTGAGETVPVAGAAGVFGSRSSIFFIIAGQLRFLDSPDESQVVLPRWDRSRPVSLERVVDHVRMEPFENAVAHHRCQVSFRQIRGIHV